MDKIYPPNFCRANRLPYIGAACFHGLKFVGPISAGSAEPNLPIASPAQISFLRLQQDCKLGSVRLPSLRMLDLFLRGLGHRTDLARNVQEVLALAVSAEKRFDLLGLRGRKPDTRFIRRLSPQ